MTRQEFVLIVVVVMGLVGCKEDQSDSSTLDNLPADGVYSTPEGSGGSYTDPIHGFFLVAPPSGFKIKERLDKTTIPVKEGFPHAGEELPRSWVDFKSGGATIGAIARKTYQQDIEVDFNFVKNELKGRGAKIILDRYITIDGVKGGEYIVEVSGLRFHCIKYIKHDLDHSLSLGGSPRDYRRYQKNFLDFVHSYRSIKPE